MNILHRIWYELEKSGTRKKAKRKIKQIGHELGVLGKKDELWFGKYRGLTVGEVLTKNPSYICWLIDNTQLSFTKSIHTKARKGKLEADASRAHYSQGSSGRHWIGTKAHWSFPDDYDIEAEMEWGGEFDGGGNMGMW
jgi:hypothetical protein